ncbi:LON peptidase substrate-binding domain-containing protein [Candidatus Woesebacteria bacterium]|nr:LON peptidase substrate-binding domain-containing protein [Candidatus Woesebacteria bacterium]
MLPRDHTSTWSSWRRKKAATENPTPKDLYQIGTLAKIERTLQHEGETHALIRGIRRVRVQSFQQEKPFPVVIAEQLEEKLKQTDEFEASLKHLSNVFRKTVQSGKAVEFFNFMQLVGGLQSKDLVDHIASALDIPTRDKQRLLEQLDVNKRVKAVIAHLTREQHILNIEQKINNETKKQIDERMRENVLRERMQAIQRELGELDEEEELDELEERIKKARMPKKIEEKVTKELRRLRQMSPMHSEYSYVMSWLESMLDMPWSKKITGSYFSQARGEGVRSAALWSRKGERTRLRAFGRHEAARTRWEQVFKKEKYRRQNPT